MDKFWFFRQKYEFDLIQYLSYLAKITKYFLFLGENLMAKLLVYATKGGDTKVVGEYIANKL
ncbi:MAG: hypothetical protein II500_01240, partial [Campylobacter sp.]|nr:hypothetical protein [Campylobacter sp.]